MAIANFDNSLLDELGLGSAPESEKDTLLAHLYDTLEARVGQQLAEKLTATQMLEFDQVAEEKGSDAAVGWLLKNVPDYSTIYMAELEKLKIETKHDAAEIIAALAG